MRLKLLRVAFSLSCDPCFWVSSRFLHRWLNFVTSIGVCMTGLVSISFVFWRYLFPDTVQKIKFSIKNFSSICDQIRRKLRIWSHLLKKSWMENFIFCAVWVKYLNTFIIYSFLRYVFRGSIPHSYLGKSPFLINWFFYYLRKFLV